MTKFIEIEKQLRNNVKLVEIIKEDEKKMYRVVLEDTEESCLFSLNELYSKGLIKVPPTPERHPLSRKKPNPHLSEIETFITNKEFGGLTSNHIAPITQVIEKPLSEQPGYANLCYVFDIFNNCVLYYEKSLICGSDEAVSKWRDCLTYLLLSYGVDEKDCILNAEEVIFNEKAESLFLREISYLAPIEYDKSLTIFTCTKIGNPDSKKAIALFSSKFIVHPSKHHEYYNGVFELSKKQYSYAKTLKKMLSAIKNGGLFPQAQTLITNMMAELDGYYSSDENESVIKPSVLAPYVLNNQDNLYEGIVTTKDLDTNDIFVETLHVFSERSYEQSSFVSMCASCYGNNVFSPKDNGNHYIVLHPLKSQSISNYFMSNNSVNKNINLFSLSDFPIKTTIATKGGNIECISVVVNLKCRGKKVRLSKVYHTRKGEIIICNGELNAVAIWPNKIDPDMIWKKYYLYQAETKKTILGLHFMPLTSTGLIPVNFYDVDEINMRKYAITPLEGFPYIIIAMLDGKELGFIAVKPAGLLMKNRNKQGYLGIDFGTTGSVAALGFASSGITEGMRIRLDYKDTGVLPVLNKPWLNDNLQDTFVGLTAQTGRYLFTALHLSSHACEKSTREYGALRQLEDANIFFAHKTKKYPNNGEVHSDIKWNEAPLAQHFIRLYVQQFVLLSLWKAMSEHNIGYARIRMAYPSSIPDLDILTEIVLDGSSPKEKRKPNGYLNNMRTIVNTAIRDALYDKSYENKSVSPDRSTDYCQIYTESYATAIYSRFWRSEVGRKIRKLGIIDIGGGSVDFALVDMNETINTVQPPELESSLAFAGKKILVDSITRVNDEIFNSWFPEDEYKTGKKKSDNVELSLASDDRLYNKIKEHKTFLLRIQNSVFYGLAGILYYFAQYLMSKSRGLADSAIEVVPIAIYFCGNGAKMQDFLLPQIKDKLNELFKYYFHKNKKLDVLLTRPDFSSLLVPKALYC